MYRAIATWCLILVAATAAAQAPPEAFAFLPLEVGNEWVFERYPGSPLNPSNERIGTDQWVVVGDTTIGGTAAALVLQTRRDNQGVVEDRARCAISQELVENFVRVTFTEIAGACRVLINEAMWPQQNAISYTTGLGDVRPFEVGGIPYPARPVKAWEASNGNAGIEVELVHGLGPAFVRWFTRSPRVSVVYILASANVGGASYGVPVSAEPEAPQSVALSLALAGENPTRGAVALRLDLSAPTAVHTEVLDALGRRVYAADLGPHGAGPSTLRLDATAWPPGVYVVRVATADGRVGTQRVVRAE